MPIQMTKKEYEMNYGVAPFIQPVSNLDISTVPIRMTREEYKAKYFPELEESKEGGILGPAKEAIQGLGTLYGCGEGGIATKLKRDVEEGAEDISKGFGRVQRGKIGGFYDIAKGEVKTGFRVAGDIVGTVFAPIGAALQAVGFNKLTDYIGEKVVESKPMRAIIDIPAVQEFAITHPNAEEDFNRALMLLFAKAEKGKIEPKTTIPRTIEQIKLIGEKTKEIPVKVQEYRISKITDKVAEEIADIESNYSALRKANEFSKDAEASRQRIAQTDVLVNTDGTIRTKQPGGAVEQYRKLTLDGAENVVRDNLVREGEIVNIGEIAKALTVAVYRSGLEGSALLRAVNGIKAELEGLKLRANELGDIELFKIHDAKISTTQNINYKTDSTPTIKFRKAKARAYKDIVETKSKISVEVNGKTYGVREINAELGKYYEDISRLENLEGKKVRGGKLGKYTAQIGGHITGGAIELYIYQVFLL